MIISINVLLILNSNANIVHKQIRGRATTIECPFQCCAGHVPTLSTQSLLHLEQTDSCFLSLSGEDYTSYHSFINSVNSRVTRVSTQQMFAFNQTDYQSSAPIQHSFANIKLKTIIKSKIKTQKT